MKVLDDLLEQLRKEGDPVPDRIIAELMRDNQMDAVNDLFRKLIRNDQAIPEALPDNIENWLRENGSLPEGADHERLNRASEFFAKNGVAISLVLATSALVECYAGKKGVKVLTYTYRLSQNPYRRVAETGQFVILVMSPGGLSPEGGGIKAIHKVRFMHAAIRYLVNQTGRWPEEELGVPICQEDLLGTLMTFSYVVIRALRILGVEVTEQEAEDFVYFWKIVGEELGIRPEYIPETFAESQVIAETIKRRHHGPSPEGVQMTKALLEMHAELIPGEMFDGIVPAMIRHLVGDEVADWMEVPKSNWEYLLKNKFMMSGLLEMSVVNKLGMSLLSREAFNIGGYHRPAFEIPTALRESWQLTGYELDLKGGLA